ncbi:MAG TPA: acetylglutamate kinase, partial [Spirochaetia bacterium]|nr:acetylglutamate kinase [Spirochaetia bacterium]
MIFVKIGGVVATDPNLLSSLLADFAGLKNHQFVLVHGGGKEVTALGEKFGLQAEFQNGIRLTSPAEMEVVDMVLGGKINIDLVRRARAAGLAAVGLGGQDGGLFTGEVRPGAGKTDSRTGTITRTDTGLLEVLTRSGYFPVVNSTSCDAGGRGLNINADEAAEALAIAARAEALVFISDIAGVLKDGQVLPRLDGPTIDAEVASGVIGGGMVPKVRSAHQAVRAGVGRVVIGGFRAPGDLDKLLSGVWGTTIV